MTNCCLVTQTDKTDLSIMSNRLKILGAVIFFSVILFINLYREFTTNKTLEEGFKVTEGWISYFGERTLRNDIGPKFSYRANGKLFERGFRGIKMCDLEREERIAFLRGVQFPVVYSTTDPSVARIIINGSDYEKYNIDVDTSSSIKRMLYECR